MRKASSYRTGKTSVIALATIMAIVATASASEHVVLVQVHVDPAYSNEPSSLESLNNALSVAPLRVVPKSSSKSPQQAIVDVVKFGPNKNPTAAAAYRQIEGVVRRLNPQT